MFQTCEWLEQVLVAQEALELDNRLACGDALARAEAAFAQIPVLAENYCRGQWENWYRECTKLNVTATMNRTREVLQLARQTSLPKGSGNNQP